MAHFILVHGMFHTGWAWSPLARALRERGHVVETPDLIGCGSDVANAGEASIERWSRAIADRAEAAGEKVILVAHSRGGLVVSQAAELAPDSMAALVYIAAMMLPDGMAGMQIPQLIAEAGHEVRPGDMTELEFALDGKTARMPSAALDRLYAPVDPAIRDWALPQVSAEPLAPLMTPLSLSDGRYGTVPRVYVATANDRLLPYEAQQAMLARTSTDTTHVLEAEHMANFTHVDALLDILVTAADRYTKQAEAA